MAYSDLGGGAFPAALQPTQGKNLYAGNYLNFTDTMVNQWTQQFLPDVYDKEVEIYGNRTISSFLRMVSAEMPSTSDQIIWLEQGRLHTRYTGLAFTGVSTTGGGTGATAPADVAAGGIMNFHLADAQNTPPESITNTQEGDDEINFRVGQTVMIQQQSTGGANVDVSRGTGDVIKGIVTHVTAIHSRLLCTKLTLLHLALTQETDLPLLFTVLSLLKGLETLLTSLTQATLLTPTLQSS